MNKVINIEDVKLKTLQVEINTLTLSGKQMTLSVFRQLPCQSIFDGNGDLRGTPWGRVNYFWKENEGDIHVVWQHENELFRSLDRAHWHSSFEYKIHNKCRNFIDEFDSWIKEENRIKEVSYFKDTHEALNEKIKSFLSQYQTYRKNVAVIEEKRRQEEKKRSENFSILLSLPQLFIAI